MQHVSNSPAEYGLPQHAAHSGVVQPPALGLAAATVQQSANVVLVKQVASDSASGSVPQRPQAFAQTSPTVSVPVSTVSQFWAM